jgi:hypothetical protein
MYCLPWFLFDAPKACIGHVHQPVKAVCRSVFGTTNRPEDSVAGFIEAFANQHRRAPRGGTFVLHRRSTINRRSIRPVRSGFCLEATMDSTTLLIVIIVLVLFAGGGFYGRGRWY